MRAEFNNLVELMNRYDLYQKDDEVGIALNELEQKITEVEKRIECARRSNQDSNSIIMTLVGSYQDLGKTEEELTYGDFETLQRGVYDVDIALNFNDKEPIENNWYGLFDEPKQEEPKKEEPPTYQCKNQHTFDKVKEVIQILKTLDNGECVDGETMDYIVKELGMEEYLLRSLIMSNPESDTKNLLEEKMILNEAKLEPNKINWK